MSSEFFSSTNNSIIWKVRPYLIIKKIINLKITFKLITNYTINGQEEILNKK